MRQERMREVKSSHWLIPAGIFPCKPGFLEFYCQFLVKFPILSHHCDGLKLISDRDKAEH